MNRIAVAGVVLASALLCRQAFAQVDERIMYASVVDDKGQPVLGLNARDLIVREDGQAREILRVAKDDDPMQVALLVDNSQAAEPYIRDYREALPAFIAALTDAAGPRNEIGRASCRERV